MLRVAGALVILALYIWFIVDVIRAPRASTRTLPKFVWLLIVILLPLLGGALWLIAGRPRYERRGPSRRRRGPVAPDDDPTFLRELDQAAWSERMRRRRADGTNPDPA